MTIETRELTPELWPALERLFGKNGACAGCWCMFWRLAPPAFAYTGTEPLFREVGFRTAQRREHGKQRVRRVLGDSA